MIWLYTGTPGSGKSLHCAKAIYGALLRKKNILANFDINMTVFPKRKKLGDFIYLDNSELTPDLFMLYAVANHRRNTNGHIVEGQTIIVIDECQILFNSRDWNAKDRMAWATFFSQHRKYGFNIILITQFDRLIDRQIRSLVEYEIKHRKASNFGTFGFLLGLLFRGNVFAAVTYWYGVRERIDCSWFVLRKRYAAIYDSYKIFAPQAEWGDPQGGPTKIAEESNVPVTNARLNLLAGKLKAFILLLQCKLKGIIKQKENSSVIYDAEYEPVKYESFQEFWDDAPPLD